MRELKFRAWDGESYMAYQGSPDLKTIKSFFFHWGDKTLMQYTGFKDKHGLDIYEDDILEVSEPLPLDGNINKRVSLLTNGNKYKVIFLEGCFYIARSKRSPKKQLKSILIRVNGLQVVGNIYENPGPLK